MPELLLHQIAYQVRVVLRTPRAVFGGVLLPVILLLLRSGDAHAGRTVAGLAVLGVLSGAYMTHATALVAARENGVLKRWRATPLPPAGYLGSRIAASVLVAVAGGAVTVAAGVAFLGVTVDAGGALSLALTFVLGALAWASIGTAVSAFIPGADAAWPVLGVTYLPVLALSGAFGAITEPGWLRTLVSYLPAQPLVDAAARALSAAPPSAHDVIVPVVWACAAFVVAQRAFRWEP